jgi:2-succinyl-6-hydroxy-2,4-cyclohexadiene-1-carboxylate synthase
MLHVEVTDGFTQTSVSWRPVIEALDGRYRIVAVDLPGHGGSAAQRAGLPRTAALVAEALAANRHGAGLPVVVGYSMGGRVGLRLALDHPDALGGLVVVGATAGIDDPAERAARHAADEALADRIEREAAGPDGITPFIERWLDQPLFAGLQAADDDLAARLANPAAGLAASLRLAGTATMDPPWWDQLPRIDIPTVVVWGEHDAKFAALGTRIAQAIGPNASTAPIADAGHAAHLEQPAAFAALLRTAIADSTQTG